MEVDDRELYKQFLNGERQAFEKIIERYEKNLKYFILKYVKDIDITEDIFQSVILYILENKEIYDDKYSLKTFLYTIAKSRALNYLKEQKTIELDNEEVLNKEEKLLEEIIMSNERKEKITKLMKKMPIEYQQAIYLCIVEGISYKEVAEIMNKTISQIKNLLHRARKKMKKLLIEEKVVEIKNNKIMRLLMWTIIIIFISSGVVYAGIKIYENFNNNAVLTPTFTGNIENIDSNSIWVGTFNLAWNELIDEYIHGKVEFLEGNTPLVEELNKQTFKISQLSEDDYYIKVGQTTEKLKKQMLKDIKNKFNIDTSSILDYIDFKNATEKSFVIYAMLYKDFEFPIPFDRLSNSKFAGSEDKVRYFGINNATEEAVNANIEVLFYNSKEEFAVKLKTKENEEIILYKTGEAKSFNEYYEDLQGKTNNYEGNKLFQEADEIRIPYINIDTIISYDELCFKTIKGTDDIFIENAMQTAKFVLNESGGKLISEAAIKGEANSISQNPRYFYLTDKFVVFMKEADKNSPYMSLKVDNTDALIIDNENR